MKNTDNMEGQNCTHLNDAMVPDFKILNVKSYLLTSALTDNTAIT